VWLEITTCARFLVQSRHVDTAVVFCFLKFGQGLCDRMGVRAWLRNESSYGNDDGYAPAASVVGRKISSVATTGERQRDIFERTSLVSVVGLFEQQVDAGPERNALRRTDSGSYGDMSFGQLDAWANAIAWELISRRGSEPEPVPLAICEPDLMLAAAVGVLKAGKFYVAVNPLHPARRIEHVLRELDAPLLLCDRRGEIASQHAREARSVEEIVAARSSGERPGLRFDEDRLAYVLYTSGSTGRPRGVAQSRRDMLHNVVRHRPLAVGRDDCVSLVGADGFVASVSNPYVALLGGATLAPYSFRDEGVDRMMAWLRTADVTVLYAFPSFLRQLAAVEPTHAHDGLRLAYLGGETVLPGDLAAARRLFPEATLSVGLNSSETGLTCLQLIPPGSELPDPVPVGRPVLDVEVAVINECGMPVAPGEPGEIEIRSDYVRPRYWGRGAMLDSGVPAAAFPTGDRGRVDADGIVYHIGRIDGMVKIRGFRVEVAEVEAAISALAEVAEVAVFAIEDGPATVELVACVVAQGAGMDALLVRKAVAHKLPPAMIPTRVLFVDALPRTPNGKLDRKNLALIATPDARTTNGHNSMNGSGESQFLPYPSQGAAGSTTDGSQRVAVERRIAEIWRSVLGAEDVSSEGDFFMFGGTSIDAISVVAQVCNEFGVRVPLRVLFETPTVKALAAAVLEMEAQSAPDSDRTVRRSTVRELIALQAPLRALPLADRRRQYELAERTFGEQSGTRETVDAGGCAAEWVVAQSNPAQPIVIYIHGGGYSLGSSRSHRHLAASIGRAADAAVLSLDYRRAPEFAFPAAVDDSLAATCWLLGHTEAPVVLAGDSAGGGLVLATMLALRDANHPLPAAGVCLSPWVDLTCTTAAHTGLADRDPLLSTDELKRMAASYLRDTDPHHPLASPIFAQLAGLPPLLIQVGTEEILLDDARAIAAAARREDVEVTLEEWPDMLHTWHWYFPVLEEGRRAIATVASFIRRHANTKLSATIARPKDEPRTAPATLIQEAHLQIVPSTTGHGYLSWVYQLNGRLDTQALALALDDVVRRHEILRVRFERRDGHLHQVATPFKPGTLKLVDLADRTKRQGLDAAIDDVEAVYESLSPRQDPRLRAMLYTIDPKTSVLAVFVAEALVDSDSGSLLSAELTRAYAEHHGTSVPGELPQVSGTSYLDHAISHIPASTTIVCAREHWTRQARNVPPISPWPTVPHNGACGGSSYAFAMTPSEWAEFTSRARTLRTTPYILVLTCLQAAIARTTSLTRFLAHSIVPERNHATQSMIGNFHSPVRIDMRLDLDATLWSALARTTVAVAEAVEYSILPSPLALPVTRTPGATDDDPLAGIRFYMFSSHGGPRFAGVRRRRFRLHGAPPAALSVSCVYAPDGRQDFVFSSTVAPQDRLERLARNIRAFMDVAVDGSREPWFGDVTDTRFAKTHDSISGQ
jgi:acetyl esterase/lipase/acyl-coenzyme A synthetase/AMP-(fatty) acid ligase